MARKLDRNDYFSTITPPENGCMYRQDGRYFDIDGNERDIKTGAAVPPRTPSTEPDPDEPSEAGGGNEGQEADAEAQKREADRQALIAWYEDKAENPLQNFTLNAMIKSVYGQTTTTHDGARAVIAHNEGFEPDVPGTSGEPGEETPEEPSAD